MASELLPLSEDAPWVARLRAGETAAFDFLFRKYSSKLYYFVLRYLRQADDAESMVQDVFLRIWQGREALAPEQSFNSYLFAAAKNAVFNLHRKKLNEQAYTDYLLHFLNERDDSTEHQLQVRELESLLQQAIDELPPRRREIFVLSRQQHLSNAEIANMLHLSVKTVENQMTAALHELRQKVDARWLLLLLLERFWN